MNLKNAVARLERAGSERSMMMEKMRDSVHDLAMFLSQLFKEHTGRGIVNLPRGYTFEQWSNDPNRPYYHLRGQDNHVFFKEESGQRHMSRESLLAFSKELAEDWLDDLSGQLEEEAGIYSAAATGIQEFLNLR